MPQRLFLYCMQYVKLSEEKASQQKKKKKSILYDFSIEEI